LNASQSSAGDAVGLQPCRIMVRSIAFDIRYTLMHQTIEVASETKVLRSTAGRDAVYLLPLKLGFIIECQSK